MIDKPAKWQPVMLVVDHRVECKCGNLAIFVTGTCENTDSYNILTNVDVWCQECFVKAQEESEEE